MSSQEATELDALYLAANRDPRMGILYSRYLKDWAEAGGGLFMYFLIQVAAAVNPDRFPRDII